MNWFGRQECKEESAGDVGCCEFEVWSKKLTTTTPHQTWRLFKNCPDALDGKLQKRNVCLSRLFTFANLSHIDIQDRFPAPLLLNYSKSLITFSFHLSFLFTLKHCNIRSHLYSQSSLRPKRRLKELWLSQRIHQCTKWWQSHDIRKSIYPIPQSHWFFSEHLLNPCKRRESHGITPNMHQHGSKYISSPHKDNRCQYSKHRGIKQLKQHSQTCFGSSHVIYML